jgi:glycerol-3-phosphate acyltransferase PlsX
MKIAVDAMGGDKAPSVVVEGSIEAAAMGIPVILVGDCATIEAELATRKTQGLPIEVKHASEVVGMCESPAQAIRKKKDSSIKVCFDLVKRGEASAVVSAGNSGAAMAAGMLVLRKLACVSRPAIAVCVPTAEKPVIVLDVGGNVDCKPLHLVQFAMMGDVYAKYILKETSPRVGLLSNGEEAKKGNELTRATHDLLKKTSLNFIGSIEGKDIFSGNVDVVVTDGFVGNVVLKLAEGLIDTFVKMLKHEISASTSAKFGYLFARGAFKNLKKKFDYDEYGGAPLLGIDGTCMISHGSSSAKAIRNSIIKASEFVKEGVNMHLVNELEENIEIEKIAMEYS